MQPYFKIYELYLSKIKEKTTQMFQPHITLTYIMTAISLGYSPHFYKHM